jgi:hypothetical protein
MKNNTFYFILISISVIGIVAIVYGIDYTNKEHEKNTWYQNGIIIDKNAGPLEDPYCLIQADDNQRYSEYCKLYLVGDKIELKMQKDYSVRIVKLIP